MVEMGMIDKETLYNLYIKQNKTQTEISNIYNCDRKNVAYYLKKFNINKSKSDIYKKHYKDKPTIDEILNYLNDGYLISDIASMYNINRSTVGKILKDNGYNMNNHKGQTKRQSQRMSIDNPTHDKDISKIATENSRKTKINNREKKYNSFDKSMTFETYSKIARQIAYLYYNKQTPKGFVIDHMFSVYDGYKNEVPLNIISAPVNLRLVTEQENLRKHKNSIVTLNELYKML